MSKKAFDLMPPYPQPSKYHHHMSKSKREKVKSRKTFFFFFFGLFFIGVFFMLMKLGNDASSSQPTNPAGSPSTTPGTSNFELFDNQGNSNLTDTQSPIRVRILNGASATSNASTAKDLLLRAGFEIEKTNPASNNSAQTTIYYKKGRLDQAQKAVSALKSNFAAQTQESASLEASYDLLITVGAK